MRLTETNPLSMYYTVGPKHAVATSLAGADLTFTLSRSQIDQINKADWQKVGLPDVCRVRRTQIRGDSKIGGRSAVWNL